MSKHTPGPWVIDGNDISPESDNALGICAISPVDVGGGKGWFVGQETLANQRLIAAAPELLAALVSKVENAEQRAFEDWLQRTCPSGDCDSVHAQWLECSAHADFYDDWKLQIAAIAKARGEE